jgi:hypothetical protein
MAEHRYEREIDDLLRRMESQHPDPLPFRLRRRTSRWHAAWTRFGTLVGVQSPVERLMGLSILLILATFALGFIAPRFAAPLGLLAVACFVAALVLSVWQGAKGHGSVARSTWQSAHGAPPPVDWDDLTRRLRRWLRRFRR